VFLWVVVNIGDQGQEMRIAGDCYPSEWALEKSAGALVSQIEGFGVCVEEI
jgi:hypothetical protein